MDYDSGPALVLVSALLVLAGTGLVVGVGAGAETDRTAQPDTITITRVEAPVETTAGDAISVSATVENTGTTPTDVTLEYRLDGQVLATDTRTLGAGESTSVEFQVTVPSDLEAGTYRQGVFVAGTDDSQTSELIVNRPGQPVFTISGFQGPSLANTGQRATARGTVENTGTASGTTTLQYRIGGQVVGTETVDLESGASAAVAIEATVPSLAAGTYQQGLFVGDSNVGQTSTIVVGTPSARFGVLTLQAPTEVRPGDSVTATATVQNTGDARGSQRFEYRVGDRVIDTATVELASGQQATLTFDGRLPTIAAGTYQQGVFVGPSNTGLTRSLTVTSPTASFSVTSLRGPSRVRSGETATATATVRNTGDARGSSTLRYRIDGTTVDSETVTLDPGASRSVSFSGTVPNRDPGTYQQGVFVDGTSEGTTASVVLEEDAAAALRISDLRAPSRAEVDEEITVTATVRNTGDSTAEERIEYRIGSRVVDRETVELRAGRSTTVRFEADVPNLRRGTYTQGVFVGETGRGQTTSLRIFEGPRFVVTNLQTSPSAVVGDSIAVEATIRNRGDTRATRSIEYRIGDRRVATEELQLDDGQQRTITLEGTVPNLTPGTYRQGVFVEGEGQSVRLEVRPRPTPRPVFGVSAFEAPSSVTAGGPTDATATVSNTGNAAGTVTVEYRIDSRVVAARQVTLDAGSQRDVSFEGTVPRLATGSYQHGVFVAGTTTGDSGTVRVQAGEPRFSIGNLRGPSQATVGDEITVRAEITNTGTAPGETVVQYRFGTVLRANESASLDVGESQTVQFTVTVPEVAARTYTHGVFVDGSNRGQTTSLVIEARPTPTPTATATPTTTTTAESGPGFGIVFAFIAVVAVGVLVGRFRD